MGFMDLPSSTAAHKEYRKNSEEGKAHSWYGGTSYDTYYVVCSNFMHTTHSTKSKFYGPREVFSFDERVARAHDKFKEQAELQRQRDVVEENQRIRSGRCVATQELLRITFATAFVILGSKRSSGKRRKKRVTTHGKKRRTIQKSNRI